MSKTIDLGMSVDQLLENLPSGSVLKAISNNLKGFNTGPVGNTLPRPRESHGYTFFTRPQLNMTDNNVSNESRMFPLLNAQRLSYQRYIRMTLDPRLGNHGMKCPFINNYNGYIPLLTNTLTNLSGWPDLQPMTHTTEAGNYGQQNSYVDGPLNVYDAYDLTATFRNIEGNPQLALFYFWIVYQTLVYEGILSPYLFMITENEVDYNTRIYKITTDSNNRFIGNISACGAAFPISLPTGSLLDSNRDKPYNDSIADVSIRFRAMGFIFNEDVLKLEFNQVNAMFNPSFQLLLKHDMMEFKAKNNPDDLTRLKLDRLYSLGSAGITKVPHHLVTLTQNSYDNNTFRLLNYNMMPYVNLATDELEWWAPTHLVKL